VEKDDEQRHADNNQDHEPKKQIRASRVLGLRPGLMLGRAIVGAVLVAGHDAHGSIESLLNYNFQFLLLKKSLV